MGQINPYLNFPGNTEEAFNFYKSVFGGEFSMLMRFKDTPHAEGVPQDALDKIMHVSLPVKGNSLMATDAIESMGDTLKFGTNMSIAVTVDSREEADTVFNNLAKGGQVTMPLSDQFWGSYFGMLTDKFGVQWMVDYGIPQDEK